MSLELKLNFTILSLDNSIVERQWSRMPARLWPLGGDGSFFLGARVQTPGLDLRGTAEGRGPRTQDGFRGCLSSVVLNGMELPLESKRSPYAEVIGLTELTLGCILVPDACQGGPCLNGGGCTSLLSGGESVDLCCISHAAQYCSL